VLWTWIELLAIAVGLSIGAAEVGMSCRMRGGPKAVVAVATGLHGVTLAVGLIVAAVAVMITGSVLELLALNGTFLVTIRRNCPRQLSAGPAG
jgi:putative Mn2+ efflux pump MntP